MTSHLVTSHGAITLCTFMALVDPWEWKHHYMCCRFWLVSTMISSRSPERLSNIRFTIVICKLKAQSVTSKECTSNTEARMATHWFLLTIALSCSVSFTCSWEMNVLVVVLSSRWCNRRHICNDDFDDNCNADQWPKGRLLIAGLAMTATTSRTAPRVLHSMVSYHHAMHHDVTFAHPTLNLRIWKSRGWSRRVESQGLFVGASAVSALLRSIPRRSLVRSVWALTGTQRTPCGAACACWRCWATSPAALGWSPTWWTTGHPGCSR